MLVAAHCWTDVGSHFMMRVVTQPRATLVKLAQLLKSHPTTSMNAWTDVAPLSLTPVDLLSVSVAWMAAVLLCWMHVVFLGWMRAGILR